MSMQSNRIVVTGASGFVGRHLVVWLRDRGHAVVALSRRGTQIPGTLSHRTDYRDGIELQQAIRGADALVHLAAAAHHTAPAARQDDELFRDNLAITQALLAASQAAGVRRFVFASSVGIHGNQSLDGPFSEQSPAAPVDAYARSKWACEEQVRAAGLGGPMGSTIVRPPLVYGPGAPGNFARLVRLAGSGLPLPLGSVRNRRSLIALDNLLDFLTLCTRHPAAANQTFLVSDNHDVSTPHLLQLAGQAQGCKVRLLPVPLTLLTTAAALLGQSDTLTRLCGSLQVDSGKARRELGWTPPLTLSQGLAKAIVGTPPC